MSTKTAIQVGGYCPLSDASLQSGLRYDRLSYLIKIGKLTAHKMGHTRFVSIAAVKEYVAKEQGAGNA